MKTLFDIVALSVAFWIAAAKLVIALNPLDTPAVNKEPPLQIVEERSDPDVELQKKQIQESAARVEQQLKAEKEAAEKKAKEKEMEAAKAKQEAKAATEKRQDELSKPKKPMEPPSNTQSEMRHWGSNLNEAVAEGKRTGLPVFIDFHGEGCIVCEEISQLIYSTTTVSPILRGAYIPVWLYVTRANPNHITEFNNPKMLTPRAVILRPDNTYSQFVPKYDPKLSQEENIQNFLSELKRLTPGGKHE